MQKNDLFRHGNDIFRVLDLKDNKAFIINCTRQTMPQWYDPASFSDYMLCTEQDLQIQSGIICADIDMFSPAVKRIIHERYTIIAGVLPFLHDPKLRNIAISRIAEDNRICKQTVRNYSEAMLDEMIPPHSSDIWNYGLTQPGANLISVDREQLLLTLLPRTTGTFTRHGLKVNQLHYSNSAYTEHFLCGGTAIVSYDPDDVSSVWIVQDGSYDRFELIDTRFTNMDIAAVRGAQGVQKQLIKSSKPEYLQAKIHLSERISSIADHAVPSSNTQIKSIRKTRNKAQRNSHVDYLKDGDKDV